MSGNQRLGLVALAVVIAAAAFVIAKPGDDESRSDTRGSTAPVETATATTSTPATAGEPERPAVKRIVIKGARPLGGVRELRFKPGEVARIEVLSNAPDRLHLHGYDLSREAKPGNPARFTFKATAEGVFAIESHTAEQAGLEPLIARVVVAPS